MMVLCTWRKSMWRWASNLLWLYPTYFVPSNISSSPAVLNTLYRIIRMVSARSIVTLNQRHAAERYCKLLLPFLLGSCHFINALWSSAHQTGVECAKNPALGGYQAQLLPCPGCYPTLNTILLRLLPVGSLFAMLGIGTSLWVLGRRSSG